MPARRRATPSSRRGESAERIAAGEDHLPDVRTFGDIGQGAIERFGRQHAFALPDRLAAEAEAAIDRTSREKLQKHPVGVAVDEPLDRAVRFVADRVGELAGRVRELARIRHELPRDRVVGIGRIDQPRERWRQGERIAGGDELEFGDMHGPNQPGRGQVGGAPERAVSLAHAVPPATGAHKTCSIRSAREASMTSRSNPSAMPEAGGIAASAARKSSSIG